MSEPVRVSPAAARGVVSPVVHVVDDDPAFLRAIARLLRTAGFAVETYDSSDAFLSRTHDAPGCAILDIQMPGPDGLDIQQAIAGTRSPLPVIFLTGRSNVDTAVRGMKGGAVDYLVKPASAESLLGAVRRALAVDAAGRQAREEIRALRERFDTLTPREREVFALVASGMLNKQIADALGTAERTIKAHRGNVMRKMAANSAADLGRAAGRLGVAVQSR